MVLKISGLVFHMTPLAALVKNEPRPLKSKGEFE
jgi:hypothetical protein